MEELKVREIKRNIRRKPMGGKDVYELTVVQEYEVGLVKNMVSSWKEKNEQLTSWLKEYKAKKEEIINATISDLIDTRAKIKLDFTKTKEEVWEAWQQELKKKQAFLDEFEEQKKQAIEKQTQQLEQIKNQAMAEFERNEKGIGLWEDAIQGG